MCVYSMVLDNYQEKFYDWNKWKTTDGTEISIPIYPYPNQIQATACIQITTGGQPFQISNEIEKEKPNSSSLKN